MEEEVNWTLGDVMCAMILARFVLNTRLSATHNL